MDLTISIKFYGNFLQDRGRLRLYWLLPWGIRQVVQTPEPMLYAPGGFELRPVRMSARRKA